MKKKTIIVSHRGNGMPMFTIEGVTTERVNTEKVRTLVEKHFSKDYDNITTTIYRDFENYEVIEVRDKKKSIGLFVWDWVYAYPAKTLTL